MNEALANNSNARVDSAQSDDKGFHPSQLDLKPMFNEDNYNFADKQLKIRAIPVGFKLTFPCPKDVIAFPETHLRSAVNF